MGLDACCAFEYDACGKWCKWHGNINPLDLGDSDFLTWENLAEGRDDGNILPWETVADHWEKRAFHHECTKLLKGDWNCLLCSWYSTSWETLLEDRDDSSVLPWETDAKQWVKRAFYHECTKLLKGAWNSSLCSWYSTKYNKWQMQASENGNTMCLLGKS